MQPVAALWTEAYTGRGQPGPERDSRDGDGERLVFSLDLAGEVRAAP